MDDQINLNNKKYFSCKYAGKISGYTNDYIARFCRQGKLKGMTVGRNWYVEEGSLNDFVQENNLKKEELKEERSERMANEYKDLEKTTPVKKIFESKLAVSSTASEVLNLPSIFTGAVFKKVAVGIVALVLVSGGYVARDANIYPIQIAKSNAQALTDNTNQILTLASDQLLVSVTSFNNSLNETKNKISNQVLLSVLNTKHSLTSNAKYLNTKVNEVSDNFLTSASSLKSATASNAKYFGNSLNKASASVLTSITSATKELINKTAQSVNNTVDSIFELFNKQPQDETPILVEETKEIQKEDKVAEEQTTKESIVKETSVQPQPKVSASSGSASGGDEPRAQVIERVVQTKEILTVGGITLQDLELAIQQSQNKIYSDMSSLTSANETRIINNYTNVSAPTNKIDKLGHVTISNSTISGTLSGLTDAHIPNDITASNYLPLSGGTLTGALALDSLSLSNTLTVNGVSTFSSFSATSTTASSTIAHGLNVLAINQTGTATSTFAQGIDLANGCFSVNGTCVGGDNALWTDNGSYLTTAGGEFIDVSYFVATSTTASTFPYASSTALTVSGSTYLGTLTGSLQAIDGLVSATSSLSSSFIEDVYLRNDATTQHRNTHSIKLSLIRLWYIYTG